MVLLHHSTISHTPIIAIESLARLYAAIPKLVIPLIEQLTINQSWVNIKPALGQGRLFDWGSSANTLLVLRRINMYNPVDQGGSETENPHNWCRTHKGTYIL